MIILKIKIYFFFINLPCYLFKGSGSFGFSFVQSVIQIYVGEHISHQIQENIFSSLSLIARRVSFFFLSHSRTIFPTIPWASLKGIPFAVRYSAISTAGMKLIATAFCISSFFNVMPLTQSSMIESASLTVLTAWKRGSLSS